MCFIHINTCNAHSDLVKYVLSAPFFLGEKIGCPGRKPLVTHRYRKSDLSLRSSTPKPTGFAATLKKKTKAFPSVMLIYQWIMNWAPRGLEYREIIGYPGLSEFYNPAPFSLLPILNWRRYKPESENFISINDCVSLKGPKKRYQERYHR